ncbi:hypothetical protein ACX40Y_08985 [Sphingomonas sp. RS6]
MENRRTETARDNDDSAVIDAAAPAPDQGGRSGGNLARDVGTDASEDAVSDPDEHRRVRKQDEIDHGQRTATDRARG